ncbi:uncharacterized protein LOC134274109 [Saccostrea cucullata]|uniref:uncharacterized protein LOC134274109 n=1 Tax=Saccostrea cuccullata TaxID=36930 RepID=UPI002ED22844
MRKVNACPVTKYEVERAAENKDCNELALKQNCTSAENFKYHCLMNELEDGFVEVCAPAYFIHGFCAEYNIQAALIQDHFNIKCKDVKPPCAERYKSSDAYLYKGCYNLILENNNLSTMESTTHKHNTSISFMINDISAESTSDWKIAVGVTTATVLVLVIILGLVIAKEKMKPNSKLCISIKTKSRFLAVETEKYMKAYRTISSYFVKTRLYEQCQRTLEQKGVAILTGLPGCGKTLTAIQIMQTSYYKDWVKRKFTSWEHFLLLEANENTLVYIDNIFDGIMYRHELQRWWDSLCYYYQTYIKSQHVKVHLLITVKDHVIDKIREYMKMEIPVFEEACIIRAISLPFMDDEKRKILDSQIKYAKNSRNILPPLIDEEFFSQVKQVNGPIGFPLCAHLFAFEERPCKKDITVFEFPIRYIINQIADEIEKDNTNGVKTLWLLLLFSYPRTDIQDQRQKLDLKYGQTCREYLEKRGSKVLLEKLEPLEFANLIEIAEDFKERMLVEHSGSCYQLKHQIYVDGVVGYFCVEKSEIAVKFFPLDLLREQDFIGVQSECRAKLIERFKKEIKDKHLSEVFACKIFRQHDFENQFSRELEKEGIADWISFSDESSTYHLPTLFWTSKYRLNRLSRMVMELIERKGENVDSHFYFARFGECCAYSENYIQNTSFEIDHIKKSVWNFKSEEGFTIFHITLLLESVNTGMPRPNKDEYNQANNVTKWSYATGSCNCI